MYVNTATQRLLYALSSGRSQGQGKQYAVPPTYAVPALTRHTLREKGDHVPKEATMKHS